MVNDTVYIGPLLLEKPVSPSHYLPTTETIRFCVHVQKDRGPVTRVLVGQRIERVKRCIETIDIWVNSVVIDV